MNERVTEQTSPREGGPGPFQPRPQPTASKGPAGLPLPRVPCGLQPAPAPPGGPGTPTSPHKLIWMPVPLLQTALPPPPGPGSQTGARSPGVPMATGPDTNSLQPTVQSHILYANAPAGAGGSIPPHPVQTLPPHPQPLLSAPAWLPDPPPSHETEEACALASPAGCGSLRQADWQFGGLLGPPCGHMPAANYKVTRTHARPRCVAVSPPSCPKQPCLPWGMGGGWSLTSVCWGRQESGSWRVGQTREAWPAAPSLGPRRRSL